MFNEKQVLFILCEHQSPPSGFWWVRVAHQITFFCAVPLCVLTFLFLCCDARNDFRIKTMLGSSLFLVVCRMAHVLLCFLCMFANSNVQHFVLSNVFMFWVSCCDVRYDFHIKTMFGSPLYLAVCRKVHVLFTLFV